jgi:hypothetical protein
VPTGWSAVPPGAAVPAGRAEQPPEGRTKMPRDPQPPGWSPRRRRRGSGRSPESVCGDGEPDAEMLRCNLSSSPSSRSVGGSSVSSGNPGGVAAWCRAGGSRTARARRRRTGALGSRWRARLRGARGRPLRRAVDPGAPRIARPPATDEENGGGGHRRRTGNMCDLN